MSYDLSAYVAQMWALDSINILEKNLTMAKLVHRDFENMVASRGDTINTRKPAEFHTHDFSDEVTVQDSSATNVQVVLNKHKEVTFLLRDKDLSLSIKDPNAMMNEFISPAMYAIADQIDQDLLALYVDVSTYAGTAGTDMTADVIVDAGKKLNDQKVPKALRNLVISSKDEAALLKLALFQQAQSNADGGMAQREASLGRKFGFNIFMDQNVVSVAGTPTTTYNLAFHKNAFALVTRPLQTPIVPGVYSTVRSDYGIGLRCTISWNASKLAHQCTVDVLYGVKTLDANLATQVRT